MIVTCEGCSTQFQLDEAKIPESGVQVQCSRCEQVFFVSAQARPDVDSPEDFAVDALLSDPRADFDSDPDALLSEDVGAEGESDWEFNLDGAIADSLGSEELTDDSDAAAEGLSIAQEAVDDLLANTGSADPQNAGAVHDSAVELDHSAVEFDDSALDSNDSETATGDPLSELEFEESASEAAEAAEAGEVGGDREIEPDPTSDDRLGLGDPEDWDLFDEPSGTRDEASPATAAAETIAPSGEAPSAAVGARPEPGVELSVALETEESECRRWTVHARAVAGWAVVSVLLLMGLHGGLASRSDGVRSGADRWTGGGFEVDRIEGRWVDNAISGPIYVVSGRLRRVAAAPSGTRLEIRLVDASGRTLDWGPAPIGPAIPNRLLRESDPLELGARQSSRAARLAMGAPDWRPFEAVLPALPDSADRFELDVSSVPAS